MAPPDIKKLLTVKIKPRKDPYSDQFSRILMVKMMMLTATFTAISWAKDKFTCIVPKNHDTTAAFVSKACWINGMYVYRGLKPAWTGHYYGIPKDISHNGINHYGEICSTKTDKNCSPMEKTFYLQYQWFPLGVVCLSFLYYLPYLLYCVVNADLIGLKEKIKKKAKDEIDYGEIITKYFDRKNSPHSPARTLLNVIVKLLYIVVNIVGLMTINSALNGEYVSFGKQWSQWLRLTPAQRHDYTIPRSPKAGHELLPGFGMCQVTSAGQDIKNNIVNEHTFICEISQHVLYQYILIVLWYMIIIGIVVSILGFIYHVLAELSSAFCIGFQGPQITRLYSRLTLRERQLLDYVRKKNMSAFGELMEKLLQAKGIKPEDKEEDRFPVDSARAEKERMLADSY